MYITEKNKVVYRFHNLEFATYDEAMKFAYTTYKQELLNHLSALKMLLAQHDIKFLVEKLGNLLELKTAITNYEYFYNEMQEMEEDIIEDK